MKKSIFTTLALSAGLTFGGLAVSDDAKAADVDYSHLAQAAQNNDVELNQKPIQAGNYDFSFSDGKFTYHFYNYNGIFGYEYQYGSTQVNNTSSQLASQEQSYNTQSYNAPEQKVDTQQKQFEDNHVANTEQPKQVEAPKKEVKQETATKTTTAKSTASNGSIEAQILAAGGDQAMVEIAKRESTLNPNATNASSGAQGLFQGLGKTWANGSVAEQTKGAKQYMIDRYGSTNAALSYHDAHNYY